MKSVVLDTIQDIGLILREFDFGGCSQEAPLDEYMQEAAEIYTIASRRRIAGNTLASSSDRACLLHDIIDDVLRHSFGEDMYDPPQYQVEEAALAILQAWRWNIEFRSGKKVNW